MKHFTLLLAKLIVAIVLFGQANIIDTSFYSNALQETMLVDVYLPPGYDENPDWNYPVIYYLHGWGGNQNNGSNSAMSIADNLIGQNLINPVIIVSADNSPGPFGGSWYINSILWGDYEDYMMIDLVSWIDNTYRTIPEKNGRALLGQSMGCAGSFRLGILYKDMFRAITGHAGPMIYDVDLWLETGRQVVLSENQPGPPYTYTFSTGGSFTRGCFLLSGAFCPNLNSPQTYINPQNVEYIFDENGEFIDTVLTKWQANDVSLLVKQLSPEDSVSIYYGCGTNDDWLLYPALSAFADTLEMLGLPYEFYSHSGNHEMPYAFKIGALNFIDSLLMAPGQHYTSCLPEGITFSTQEEIDNFQINYPNCDEIEGNVTIGDWLQSDIKTLNGLNVLKSLGGDLIILGNDSLTSLIGLGNVISVGGDLTVWDNDSLNSLAGLDNLASIEGNCKIGGNNDLDSLLSLEGLTFIGGDLEIGFQTGMVIWGNFSLTSLEGLNNLTSIGGSLKVRGNISLANLMGLNNLTSIGGEVFIDYNDSLISLTGLENIEEESISNLFISSNGLLSTCNVQSICDYLANPNGTIHFWDNAPGCNSPEEVEEACLETSVEKISSEFEISISPNPVNDYAVLSLNGASPGSIDIRIFNTTGICIKNRKLQNEYTEQVEFTLELKDLPSGIYLCWITVGNKIVTKKIIKQ